MGRAVHFAGRTHWENKKNWSESERPQESHVTFHTHTLSGSNPPNGYCRARPRCVGVEVGCGWGAEYPDSKESGEHMSMCPCHRSPRLSVSQPTVPTYAPIYFSEVREAGAIWARIQYSKMTLFVTQIGSASTPTTLFFGGTFHGAKARREKRLNTLWPVYPIVFFSAGAKKHQIQACTLDLKR